MRVRDIILKVDQSNIGSIGIGNATQSEYSHTSVHTELNDVIEAEYPKSKKTDFEKWKKRNSNREYYFSDWYDCQVDVYSYVDMPYETGRFVNFEGYRLFTWLKLPKIAEWFINRDNSRKIVCSELNGLCRGLKNPHLLTPQDFVKFIKLS